MATRTITDRDDFELLILGDSGGPSRGLLVLFQSDGRREDAVIIGAAGTGVDVTFASLGTAQDRQGFANVLAAARAAARTKRGYA